MSTERQSREVAEAARETEWTLPSFGKELFLGRLRLDLVHPHPRASAEDRQRGEEFLSRLEKFLRTSVDPLVIERDGQIPDAVVRGLAKLGALGMTVPEQYGGVGLSKLYYTRALQLAGSVSGAISTLLSAHQSIGVAQPLMIFGTEEQKTKYLPLVATTEISAFLLTEPDVGSDPARMSSSAVPTEDGTAYILNGLKLWTTNGVIADRLVVMAKVPRSEGHRGGISAFIVDAHAPGITVERRNNFMGLKGIENGVTRFENVRVPAEDIVGAEGLGLKIALTTLNTGRLSLPAVCAASTKWALKIAREWSNERVQWGKPIGQHEAVAQKIAYIAALAYGQESVVDVCALLADNKKNDIRIEAALAKLFCSEMAWLAVDELIQIRGGRGFETAASLKARGEKPVACEQVLRDLRINRIFEGSSEIMRLLIAREAVDQHLKVAGALVDDKTDIKTKARAALGAGKFYAGWLPQLAVGQGTNPRGFAEFGALAEHIRVVERSSRKLARSIVYGMGRWQARLEYRQAFLGRLVDIAAELFAMTCACVRAQMLVQDGAPEASGAVDLADLFCRGSRRRVDRLFHDLMHNDDAHNYETAQRVLEGQFLWAEAGIIDPSGEGPMLGLPEKTSTNVHRGKLAKKSEKTEKVAAVG
ncbi:MAG TPA: acyl-CoA dehydrogenase family protein [Gaiellaceae bacterium]|nr:acyl-CoA dehydrogenase family protein [Gaiellaceae bacterium]